jgi:hypothetical protein
MVLNASSKIAVKCSECGKYNITHLNFFKLNIPTRIRCSCGQKMIMAKISNSALDLNIECIACEKTHSYRFKLKDVLEKPLNIISCPNTGMEIAFLGKDSYVEEIVDRYMDDVCELLKYLGVIEEERAGNLK